MCVCGGGGGGEVCVCVWGERCQHPGALLLLDSVASECMRSLVCFTVGIFLSSPSRNPQIQ